MQIHSQVTHCAHPIHNRWLILQALGAVTLSKTSSSQRIHPRYRLLISPIIPHNASVTTSHLSYPASTQLTNHASAFLLRSELQTSPVLHKAYLSHLHYHAHCYWMSVDIFLNCENFQTLEILKRHFPKSFPQYHI